AANRAQAREEALFHTPPAKWSR
ncbi:hypothetical protein VCHC68A1_01741B, partial [Vibrio cholerae HC-68A1]